MGDDYQREVGDGLSSATLEGRRRSKTGSVHQEPGRRISMKGAVEAAGANSERARLLCPQCQWMMMTVMESTDDDDDPLVIQHNEAINTRTMTMNNDTVINLRLSELKVRPDIILTVLLNVLIILIKRGKS